MWFSLNKRKYKKNPKLFKEGKKLERRRGLILLFLG